MRADRCCWWASIAKHGQSLGQPQHDYIDRSEIVMPITDPGYHVLTQVHRARVLDQHRGAGRERPRRTPVR
jgi:hypothetical protein